MNSSALASFAASTISSLASRRACRRRCSRRSAAEQDGLLQHEADLVAQRLAARSRARLRRRSDRALRRVVEARDQVDRASTCPRRSDRRSRPSGRPGSRSGRPAGRACPASYPNATCSNAIVPVERRRGLARPATPAASASAVEDRLDAVHADRPPCEAVLVIFARSCIGLNNLPRYRRKTTSEPAVISLREDQARAVPEDEGRAERGDDVHDRREQRLDPPRLERRVDRLLAALGQLLLLEVSLRERLDRRGSRRGTPRRSRRSRSASRGPACVDCLTRRVKRRTKRKQERRDRHRDQRELPVEVEHDARTCRRSSQRRRRSTSDRRREEGLDVVDVVGDRREDVPELVVVVVGEREALQVVVDLPAQVVREVLADARRQVGVEVGGDRRRRARSRPSRARRRAIVPPLCAPEHVVQRRRGSAAADGAR